MPVSSLEAPYFRSTEERLEQGDIYRDVVLREVQADSLGIELIERRLSYCVVLTQDCDLQQDFDSRANAHRANDDKFLRSLLLAPAFEVETFRSGTHLSDLGRRMHSFERKELDRAKQNNMPRYHFLAGALALQLPDLFIDFKQVVAVPRETLYLPSESNETYLATVEILFREHLSARFASFLSRIGLPESPSDA